MIVGFTGTREGMTTKQRLALKPVLQRLFSAGSEFHHGDCIGADEEAHYIARTLKFLIAIHPPIGSEKRAFCLGDRMYDTKAYLERNHDIVDACNVLIAIPQGFKEELMAGTWATIRYASKGGDKPITIIYPDGLVLSFRGKGWPHQIVHKRRRKKQIV